MIDTIYGMISVSDYDDSDLISACLSTYGEWGYAETLVASTLVNNSDTIWDIGAHLGTFSLGLAMNAQVGQVLAVDANPEITGYLETNLLNNLNVNFSTFLAGVSFFSGYGSLYLADTSNHGAARFILKSSSEEQSSDCISSITLQELRSRYGNYDFLKLDIEGMEVSAIQGDADYINKRKPVIWAECNEDKQSFILLDKLIELGYAPLYVAFPVIRSEKRQTPRQVIHPMAYEAALVCGSPERLKKLTTSAISDPCIVRKVSTHNDLRQALWDTPRWARQEWVDLSKPELVARIGHLERGDDYETFPELNYAIGETPDITRERNSGVGRSPEGILQVFWAATQDERSNAFFSEHNAQSASVPLDGTLRSLSFILPADQGPIRVRIDPLDRIGLVTLGTIKLVAQQDEVLWLWERSCGALHNMSGILEFPVGNGCSYICVNTDPQFEILIPAAAFACRLEKLSIKIEIKVEALEQGLPKWVTPVTHKAGALPPLSLSQDIASLAEQITQSLADRDQTIVNQHQQLHQMRNELLRAEAQVDLLKEVMLGGRDEDRI
jgi:FkbM family methyltransferase